MKLSIVLTLCFLFTTVLSIAQSTPDLENSAPASFENKKEPVLAPLKLVQRNTTSYKQVTAQLKTSIRQFSIFGLADNYPEIQKQAGNTNNLIFQLPVEQGGVLKLKLVKQTITTPDFLVKTSDGKTITDVKNLDNNFSGSIKDEQNSITAISFGRSGIKGFISNADGNKVIEALPLNKSGLHILYNDKDLVDKPAFNCGTKEVLQLKQQIEKQAGYFQRPAGNCKVVKMYIECSYAMYKANDYNIDDVIAFVFSVFNASSTIFKNDGINIQLSEMFIWTQPEDIYRGVNEISGFAFILQTKLFKEFQNGKRISADIAQFITPDNFNGGISINTGITSNCGKLNGMYACAASSSINPFPALPAYSSAIHIFTHETGHLLGSPHTQNCSWPGGAIDNCAPTEGGCARGPAPVNGGTIMSYCHVTPYGVNFLNGFGPLPSALIRDAIDRTNCLSLCGDTVCENMQLKGVVATINNTTLKLKWRNEAPKYRIGVRPNTNHQWQYFEVIDTDSFVLAKTSCETFYDYSITPFCASLNKYGTSYIAVTGDTQAVKLNFRSVFGSSSYSLCAGDSVYLSVTPDSDFNYRWYINGTLQNQFTGDSIQTPYTGKYNVIAQRNGCTYYSDSVNIVMQPQNARIVANISNLQVDFSVSSTCSKTFLWIFGDGTQSSNSVVTHKYAEKGIYNVTLKVWDAAGNMEQVQKPLYLLNGHIDSLNGFSKLGLPSAVDFSSALCRQAALFSVDSFNISKPGIFPVPRLLYFGGAVGNSIFKTPATGTLEFKLYPKRGLIKLSAENSPMQISDTGYVLNVSFSVPTEKNRFFLFFSKWGGIQVAVDSVVLGTIANGVAGPLVLNKWNNIGISYGDQGIQVMVNGQLYASDTHPIDSAHASLLGRFNFGTYLGRIGYSAFTPFMYKGFEGALDLVRFSYAQKDFTFSSAAAWQGTDTVTISKQICNGGSYMGYQSTGTYFNSSVTASGCDSITRINLLVNAPIEVQYNLIHPLDTTKGNIFTGNISGAVKPIKYEWNTGDTTKDLINIPAGKYILKITDATGCEKRITHILYQLNSRTDHVTIFPNPVAENKPLLLRIGTAIGKKYSYIIYDVAGRKYLENSFSIQNGVTEIQILHKLLKGFYVMYLRSGNEKHSLKFYIH